VLGGQHPDNVEDLVVPKDPAWPGRLAATNIYYAQKAYFDQNDGTYASTLSSLCDFVDEDILEPFDVEINLTKDGYTANLAGNPDGSIVTIRQDRFLLVAKSDEEKITTS
jgi:hypothetical protein